MYRCLKKNSNKEFYYLLWDILNKNESKSKQHNEWKLDNSFIKKILYVKHALNMFPVQDISIPDNLTSFKYF